jgi:hypothetical protein
MEVSGQSHAPDVISPGKQLPGAVGSEAEWTEEPIWKLWSDKPFCVCRETKPYRPAHKP